jgi:O-antigen/teichoic acid export membrane protein
VLLVAVLELGVFGMVLADVCVTVLLAPILLRWFVPLIRPTFSRAVLREALRFGLPRVPHGMAQQVAGPTTDAFLLRLLLREPVPVAESHIGIYGNGASFGLVMKLFLSAFEYAWAPFIFSTMKETDARRTFSVVTMPASRSSCFSAGPFGCRHGPDSPDAPCRFTTAVVVPWLPSRRPEYTC